MVKILIPVCLTFFGFLSIVMDKEKSYDELWSSVAKYEKERLPQSAHEVIDVILSKSKQEGNRQQETKASIYKCKYLRQSSDQGFDLMMAFLAQQIESVSYPHKAILHQSLAIALQQYLQANYYKINQRQLLDEKVQDIKSWSYNIFLEEILYHIEMSLVKPESCKNDISGYSELLQKYDQDNDKYYPSLYDALLKSAIDLLENNLVSIIKPIDHFEINNEAFLYELEKFIDIKISENELEQINARLISIYQKALIYSTTNNHIHATAKYDLARTKFIHQNYTGNNKEELLKDLIDEMTRAYAETDILPEIAYERLTLEYRRAIYKTHQEQMSDDDPMPIIIRTLKEFATKYPKTKGGQQCAHLYNQIQTKNLNVRYEPTVLPDEPILISLNSQNLQSVDFQVYKLENEALEKIKKDMSWKHVKSFLGKNLIRKGTLKIKDTRLYYPAISEFALPALDKGNYLVKISEGAETKNTDAAFYGLFQVSELSYFLSSGSKKTEMVIVDRKQGNPLPNVNVEIHKSYYDRNARQHVSEFVEKIVSNSTGIVSLNHLSGSKDSYRFKLSKDEDYLSFDNQERFYHRAHNKQGKVDYMIFTDRSIYRPGQTLHYKVIALRKDADGVPSIIPNHKFKIYFRDANHQVVGETNLVSSEFGSISGTFTCPSEGLKGNYGLAIDNSSYGYKTVRVEEYKRPKFFVEMDSLKSSYKLNDKVDLTATAKSFSGVPIQEAKYSYTITRTVQFPFWRSFRPYPNLESKVISRGEGLTDKEGLIDLSFNALGDEKVRRSWSPNFSYKVELSVTDINGETQFETSYVTVSTKPFAYSTDLAELIDLDDRGSFYLSSKNSSGVSVASEGKVYFYKRIERSYNKRERYWPKPNNENSILDSSWVDYVYGLSSKEEMWSEQASVVLAFNIDGKVDEGALLNLPEIMESGQYRMVVEGLNVDFPNDTVHFEKVLEFVNWKSSDFPATKWLFTKLNKSDFSAGDKVIFSLGSSVDQLSVHYRVERRNEISDGKTVQLDLKHNIELDVNEADYGGLGVHISYVFENRFFTEYVPIQVSWKHKDLVISYESFRDKLTPGNKEVFKVNIRAKNNQLLPMELVAGMYDASLDQFIKHSWVEMAGRLYPNFRKRLYTRAYGFNQQWINRHGNLVNNRSLKNEFRATGFPSLDFTPLAGVGYRSGGLGSRAYATDYYLDGVSVKMAVPQEGGMRSKTAMVDKDANAEMEESTAPPTEELVEKQEELKPSLRENLQETAFFYPSLLTDNDGNLNLSFTVPDALTEWKLLSFAHDKELRFGFGEQKFISQKDLMIVPNVPRFIRMQDQIRLEAKLINMTDEMLVAQAYIQFIDPISGNDITEQFTDKSKLESIELKASESNRAEWWIDVPEENLGLVECRYYVKTDNATDGESHMIPVLTDRVLVTESRAFYVEPNTDKSIVFDQLKNVDSESLVNHKYVLEYTGNPAWYAIQALPYVMEQSRPNSIQLVNRWYANTLASHILNVNPKIKAVFNKWKTIETDAFLSQLDKNQSLKSALLNETPWVMNARNESEAKKRIALLFDFNKMSQEMQQTKIKLEQMQLSSGAFPWFEGGRENVYVSRYILETIAHLYKLTGGDYMQDPIVSKVVNTIIGFLDKALKKNYEDLLKHKLDLSKDHLDMNVLHYLYARSYFNSIEIPSEVSKAYEYYLSQADTYGNEKGIYGSALSAFVLYRSNNIERSMALKQSLIERSLQSDALGRYWNTGDGYSWYDMPIENQALMIELLNELGDEDGMITDMKKWLLLNKQTNHWKTDKSTASAIYALLITNEKDGVSSAISGELDYAINIDGLTLTESDATESGTGYVKKTWTSGDVNSDLATVHVSNNSENLAWGGLHWQYFEDISKVKSDAGTSLNLKKKIYKVISTDSGNVLEDLKEESSLVTGDRLMVRLELFTDRSLEFVHLKDSRASGLEPMTALSRYRWSHGLFYYESPSDVAMDYFMDYMPKGNYVFEYPLVVSNLGNFSSGLATIQCMYAPEFNAHSEGMMLKVK